MDAPEVNNTSGAAPETSGTTGKEVVSATPVSTESTASTKDTQAKGQVSTPDPNNVSNISAAPDKSYTEMRKWTTRVAQENSAMRQQLDTLKNQQTQILEALNKATERPHDPDQFMEELRTQGPNYFKSLFSKEKEALEQSFVTQLQERDQVIRKLEIDSAIKDRRADPKTYPDFQKLEAEMKDTFLEGNLPFDPNNLSTDELIDSLYNLVTLRHSQEAINAAEQLGRSKAEAELARESATTVAGGGKHVGTAVPDFSKMSSSDPKFRQWFVDKFGEAGSDGH